MPRKNQQVEMRARKEQTELVEAFKPKGKTAQSLKIKVVWSSRPQYSPPFTVDNEDNRKWWINYLKEIKNGNKSVMEHTLPIPGRKSGGTYSYRFKEDFDDTSESMVFRGHNSETDVTPTIPGSMDQIIEALEQWTIRPRRGGHAPNFSR